MKDIPQAQIYVQDEMRYGTRTELGRRWMPSGERPVCRVRIGYEYGLLYTAICPYNGDLFALFLPNMTTACFEAFSQALLQHRQQPTTLILDRARCHTSAPPLKNLQLIFLPPLCPELNPAERFFKELRKTLKLRLFHTLKDIEDKITQILHTYWQNPKVVISITRFPYLCTQ